eukprot:PhF_6_TR38585/c2_g1_i1/m.57330
MVNKFIIITVFTTALLLFPRAITAQTATLLIGTGSSGTWNIGEGLAASAGATSISATTPVSLWFNFISEVMYFSEYDSCTIRQMAYFKGIVSLFAGSSGSCTDGAANANPASTTIHNQGGGLFRAISTTEKYSFVCDRGSNRIRTFDHVNGGAMASWAGTGSSGTAANQFRTSAPLNNPIVNAFVNKVMFIAEMGNTRVLQISYVSGIATAAVSSLTNVIGVSSYRAYFYYVRYGVHNVFICHYVTKTCNTFFGDGTAGNTFVSPATTARLNDPRHLYVDCVRKSMFVTEYSGYIVREVNLVSGSSSLSVGVYGVSTYTGPGPMTPSTYGIQYPAVAHSYRGYLYVGSHDNRMAIVDMVSTSYSQQSGC